MVRLFLLPAFLWRLYAGQCECPESDTSLGSAAGTVLPAQSFAGRMAKYSETVLPHEMKQSIAHIALVVRDYDEAMSFFTETLDFRLVEDSYQPDQDKRWVLLYRK